MASNEISQKYARHMHAETQKQKQVLEGSSSLDEMIAAIANVHIQQTQAMLETIESLEARIDSLESGG